MRFRTAATAIAAATTLLAAATASAQVDLVYSTYISQGSSSNLQYEAYLDELSRRTDGAVKVQDKMYMSALMKAGEHLSGIGQRLADVGYFCTGYTPAALPLTSMAEMPYVTDKGDAVSAALAELYETYEPLQQEYAKQNVVVLAFDAPSATIIGVDTPVSAAADLKGLKVRAYGEVGNIVKQAADMIPVPMSTADIYTALQTGAIDGYVGIPLWMPGPENWLPHTKTIVAPGIGTYYTCGLAMNKDVHDALPQKVKDEIVKMRREFPPKSIDYVRKGDAGTVAKAQELGVSFYRFTPEEVAAWKQAVHYDKLQADWIESRQARTDADVAAFLKVYRDTLAKYIPQSTYEQKFPQ
ncbi:MAG: TRAP transporter substrate-binding protein DctP [Sneathiellaceae bacterium]